MKSKDIRVGEFYAHQQYRHGRVRRVEVLETGLEGTIRDTYKHGVGYARTVLRDRLRIRNAPEGKEPGRETATYSRNILEPWADFAARQAAADQRRLHKDKAEREAAMKRLRRIVRLHRALIDLDVPWHEDQLVWTPMGWKPGRTGPTEAEILAAFGPAWAKPNPDHEKGLLVTSPISDVRDALVMGRVEVSDLDPLLERAGWVLTDVAKE